MSFIGKVEVGKWYLMNISLAMGKVMFTLCTERGALLAHKSESFIMPNFRTGYFLDFFMGGNKPARKDTIAWIEN
jgi:hypothetical protein